MVVRRGVDGAGAAFTLYGQGGRAIIGAWDRPSYGVPTLGDGHLQSPHCQDWR